MFVYARASACACVCECNEGIEKTYAAREAETKLHNSAQEMINDEVVECWRG